MIRKLLLGAATLAFTVTLVGCGEGPNTGRSDMPVNAAQGVDKKGKATKTMEATLQDPPKK